MSAVNWWGVVRGGCVGALAAQLVEEQPKSLFVTVVTIVLLIAHEESIVRRLRG